MEESVKMAHTNRDCHPGGEKVYLVSATQAEELVRRRRQAETELQELQLQTRLSTLAIVAVCSLVALFGFLLGILM